MMLEKTLRAPWTEDKMVGWHHQLNAHEFEQTLGDGEGQGTLVHGITKSRTQLGD